MPRSVKATSKTPLIFLVSYASFRQELLSASIMDFSNPPVNALEGLAYYNLHHTFQLNTLTSEWPSESSKVMDTTTNILTPLENNSLIHQRTSSRSNTNMVASDRNSKSSQKEDILICVLSLRSSREYISWMKTNQVLKRKNCRTTILYQKYPSSSTTSLLEFSKTSQCIPLPASYYLPITANRTSLSASPQYSHPYLPHIKMHPITTIEPSVLTTSTKTVSEEE